MKLVWLSPLAVWITYHILILAILFFGAIEWDIPNTGLLVGFVASCNIVFASGFISGRIFTSKPASHDHTLFLLKGGIVLTILLLLPNLYIYTGKGLGDIASAASDQGAAWQQTQDTIVEGAGSRGWFALVRAVLAPFTLSFIPLFALRWTELTVGWRLGGILAFICIIIFSLARGTDKETIEIALLISFSFVAYILISKKKLRLFSFSNLGAALIIIVVGLAAISLFSERKNQRLNEAVIFCQPITKVCADTQHPSISWMPESSKFTASIITNYLSQGFYGLSIALEEPFDTMGGLGHSSFIMSQIDRHSSFPQILDRSFIYKLDYIGWPRKTSWSSAYTWIANDLGFAGTVLAMFFWGLMLSMAWRDFILNRNYAAYLVCTCFVITLFYMPMNFQITQTIDYYFPAVVWTLIWLWTRGAKRKTLRNVIAKR